MRPNYQLKVYSDEFFTKDGNEPKTIPLASCEYWEMTSVTGNNAEFLGISTQVGTDATGSVYIDKAYEDRQIEFTLAIKADMASAAELELIKYVKPGTNAILYNAAAGTLGNDIYLKGAIAECYVTKDQQNATATIVFQPFDRFWYQSNVSFTNKVDDRIEVLTDAPVKPYIKVAYDMSASTSYLTTVNINFDKYIKFYNKDSYSPSIDYKTAHKGFTVDLTGEKITAQGLTIVINFENKSISFNGVNYTSNITKYTKDTETDEAWDWTLDAGIWNLSVGMAGTTTYPVKTISGYINPKWAVYPYKITSPDDGFIYSKNLTPDNIKKGITILGVTGALEPMASFDTVNTDTTLRHPIPYIMCRLTSLDLSNYNFGTVEDMSEFFAGFPLLKTLTLTNVNTQSATNMSIMFNDCKSLTELDLSSFSTSNVTLMTGMFDNCSSLISLNLSSFDTAKVINMHEMFSGCNSLVNLTLGDNWGANSSLTKLSFYDCNNLSVDSLNDIVNKLAYKSSSSTLAMSQKSINLLTSDQKSLLGNKQWVLTSSDI